MEASRAVPEPRPRTSLRLFKRPADRAFEQLYKRHARDVYQYALALLANPVDAEDVTQTTFLNAYRAFQQGERPHKPHNWLIAIAHNVCRMRWRQAGSRPREVALEAAAVVAIGTATAGAGYAGVKAVRAPHLRTPAAFVAPKPAAVKQPTHARKAAQPLRRAIALRAPRSKLRHAVAASPGAVS